jgi:hypothetical protein
MEHDGAPLCLGRVVFWVVHGFTCGHRFEDVDEHGRILELGSVCNLARCSLCGVRVESIFHDFELNTTLPFTAPAECRCRSETVIPASESADFHLYLRLGV